MTVATQVKQTLASLKGVYATLSTYALQEEDQALKAQLLQCEEQIAQVVRGLEERIQQLELQEPQFKGY
jgi:uncharacterized protein